METLKRILLVEDDPKDIELTLLSYRLISPRLLVLQELKGLGKRY